MDEQAAHADRTDSWDSGDAYEAYVGRWSRLVAREFLGWLAAARLRFYSVLEGLDRFLKLLGRRNNCVVVD